MGREIRIEVELGCSIEKAWKCWTEPDCIVLWNHASEDWRCPSAANDLRAGGAFSYRMEAVDGSAGFDFGGVYTAVEEGKLIASVLGDGRKLRVSFEEAAGRTRVVETFEAEDENPPELQRKGWQAILDNYKKVAERGQPISLR
jgi:uncharacterized protein YndB with AHSA1/START domain